MWLRCEHHKTRTTRAEQFIVHTRFAASEEVASQIDLSCSIAARASDSRPCFRASTAKVAGVLFAVAPHSTH